MVEYVDIGEELSKSLLPSEYVIHQPAFHFFPGFDRAALHSMLVIAERNGECAVWVPEYRVCNDCIRLSTWYVRALLANC